VEGSAIEPLVKQVWAELEERGLKFKPHVWVSTEWFSRTACRGSRSRSTSCTRACCASSAP
jgi:hypothetical protein